MRLSLIRALIRTNLLSDRLERQIQTRIPETVWTWTYGRPVWDRPASARNPHPGEQIACFPDLRSAHLSIERMARRNCFVGGPALTVTLLEVRLTPDRLYTYDMGRRGSAITTAWIDQRVVERDWFIRLRHPREDAISFDWSDPPPVSNVSPHQQYAVKQNGQLLSDAQIRNLRYG